MEACSVLSDCRKAGVPDESRRNSVGSDQERRPRSMSQTSAVGSAVTFMWHPSKSPSLASRDSPRARQRRRCCSVRSAVLSPNSVGSDQRAPTTKNESDNSGTEGGEELLQPAPRSRLASCSSTLLSAMLALLSSFAFASRDSSLRTSSLAARQGSPPSDCSLMPGYGRRVQNSTLCSKARQCWLRLLRI